MNAKKIITYVVVLGILGAIAAWLYGFYLPKQDWYNDMKKGKGGSYTAVQIVQDFMSNEDSAMKKYPSDKKIEVTGIVKESKIENGKTNVVLQSNDSTASVSFILKDSIAPLATGSTTKLQGICTGFIGDVQFTDGVIVK